MNARSLRLQLLQLTADVPFYTGILILAALAFVRDPYALTDMFAVILLFGTSAVLGLVLRWEIRRGRA